MADRAIAFWRRQPMGAMSAVFPPAGMASPRKFRVTSAHLSAGAADQRACCRLVDALRGAGPAALQELTTTNSCLLAQIEYEPEAEDIPFRVASKTRSRGIWAPEVSRATA